MFSYLYFSLFDVASFVFAVCTTYEFRFAFVIVQLKISCRLLHLDEVISYIILSCSFGYIEDGASGIYIIFSKALFPELPLREFRLFPRRGLLLSLRFLLSCVLNGLVLPGLLLCPTDLHYTNLMPVIKALIF